MNPGASLLALLLISSAAAADFSVIAHYPVGGDVRYDYLRVDPAMRRLYVSHGDRVDVLDADSGAVLGAVAPMKGVHGIAVVPELKRGFVTSGSDRTVVMFDVDTLKVIKVITGLGVKPDAIEYDPQTNRVFVANGASGGITVIDPARGEIAATIPIEGKLEGLAFDGRGRLFVNTEDKSVIQVIDTQTLKPVAAWPISPVDGGTGLAIDAAHHRLFSAGGNGKLAVVDSDTGALVATPEIGTNPDGDAFDPSSGLIFTSSMGGTVSVLHEDSPDAYSAVQTVPTAFGARTIALDTKTCRVFLSTGKFLPAPTPTADNPRPWRQGQPGSFEVLVVGR
ncbi:MAG TPA: PQQ-binding-like beta-propeller repeat protein [Opitutaceae bacterium]|nr:PQQ-binding-like beta-propeller repeat protein [Opitutaceae bacterium]